MPRQVTPGIPGPDCQQFDSMLATLDLGLLSADESAALGVHLTTCQRCRSELASYRAADAWWGEKLRRWEAQCWNLDADRDEEISIFSVEEIIRLADAMEVAEVERQRKEQHDHEPTR